jgi:nitrite reductase/ring-hydroxylating ferredoxin subunit
MSSKIASIQDVKEGAVTKVQHNGKSYVLTKVGADYYAVENRCPHLGLPLAGGRVQDGTITCPFHGSRFDICTGANLDWVNGVLGVKTPKWTHKLIGLGQQPAPVTSHKLTVEGDALKLE